MDVTYAPALLATTMTLRVETYLDLFASYMLTSKVKLSVGMNNAFDTAPPQTATTYTGTSTLFDVVGEILLCPGIRETLDSSHESGSLLIAPPLAVWHPVERQDGPQAPAARAAVFVDEIQIWSNRPSRIGRRRG